MQVGIRLTCSVCYRFRCVYSELTLACHRRERSSLMTSRAPCHTICPSKPCFNLKYALFICVMKTFSIMETQHNLARVLREVEAGYEVGITRRRKLVARILPVEGTQETAFPDFNTRAEKVWGTTPASTSSDQLLDESRGDR